MCIRDRLNTFNCGVGFNVVVSQQDKRQVMEHLSEYYPCYEIGVIENGQDKVEFENKLNWL